MAQQTGARLTEGGGSYRGYETSRDRAREKTPAQLYCKWAGLALLLAGIVGFAVESSFDTGSGVDGDKLLGIFEISGWHNIVHILSGLVLFGAASRRGSAKTVALVFGLVYGLVALIGLIDGDTVLGWFPVNPGDNVLHIALAVTGILASIASPRPEDLVRRAAPSTPGTTGRRIDTIAPIAGSRRD